MRKLCFSLGTSRSLVVVSGKFSPVVVSVSTAAAVGSSSSIVSGSAMVSLAVVLVLLVVSSVVVLARHDEKKFVLFQRGELLCDDQK